MKGSNMRRLVMIIFAGTCFIVANSLIAQDSENADNDMDQYLRIGVDLMKNESIGFLSINTRDADKPIT
jgi:hypothetical protein